MILINNIYIFIYISSKMNDMTLHLEISPAARMVSKIIRALGTICESPFRKSIVELAWRSGSIMDSHATTRGSIPDGNGVFAELHVLRKGQ